MPGHHRLSVFRGCKSREGRRELNIPRLVGAGGECSVPIIASHPHLPKASEFRYRPASLGVLLLPAVLLNYGVSDGPSLSTMLSEILGKDFFFHLSSVKQISIEKVKNPYLCSLGQRR